MIYLTHSLQKRMNIFHPVYQLSLRSKSTTFLISFEFRDIPNEEIDFGVLQVILILKVKFLLHLS